MKILFIVDETNFYHPKFTYSLYKRFKSKDHIFNVLEISTCLDCGIPESMCATNMALLTQGSGNAIHPSAVVTNSDLTHCTISENCNVNNAKLTNVIMLPGSKVINQHLENMIIGFDACLESERSRIIL